MTAKVLNRYDIHNFLQPKEELEVGKTYEAYNVHKTEEGNVFFTEEGHYIYVYFKHMRKIYRIGEKAEVKITIDKSNYQYNGTLIEQKELMFDGDKEIILNYLKQNSGVMNYTDKSSAEDVVATFKMSKKAFKRALGALYKDKLVLLEKEQTFLAKDIDN